MKKIFLSVLISIGIIAALLVTYSVRQRYIIITSNEIMSNIYNDILKIKDNYQELEDFGKGNLVSIPEMPGRYASIKGIRDDSCGTRIFFNDGPEGAGISIYPVYKIYVKKVGLYLLVYCYPCPRQIPKFLEEIIKIVNKNVSSQITGRNLKTASI